MPMRPTQLPPLTLKELLPNRAIGFPYFFQSINDMQPTMLQPVGGMDAIARAIHAQVKPPCTAQFAGDGDPADRGSGAGSNMARARRSPRPISRS